MLAESDDSDDDFELLTPTAIPIMAAIRRTEAKMDRYIFFFLVERAVCVPESDIWAKNFLTDVAIGEN
jgi:hypothetical protein